MTPNIPGFARYFLSDDNKVLDLLKNKEVTLSKQTNSPNTYRCNLISDEGKRTSIALNRIILLARGNALPVGKGLHPVPGCAGLFINTEGEVWSAPKRSRAYGIWLVVDYPTDPRKYPRVNCAELGTIDLHQLLAITFLDKDYLKKGLCVMHLDDDKHNHSLSNLKIGTYSENNKAAYETGANRR